MAEVSVSCLEFQLEPRTSSSCSESIPRSQTLKNAQKFESINKAFLNSSSSDSEGEDDNISINKKQQMAISRSHNPRKLLDNTQQKSQCVAYQMVVYSNCIEQQAVMKLKCLIHEYDHKAPTIIAFKQYKSEFNGLEVSQADVQVDTQNMIHKITVKYHELDQGCFMYLYVGFSEQIYELIPITYLPIALKDNSPFNSQIYHIDFNKESFNKVKLIEDAKYVNFVDQKHPTLEFQKELVDIIDIGLETVNPAKYLDQYILHKGISFENMETHFQNNLLKKNFGSLLDFTGDVIINEEQLQFIYKNFDKKQFIKSVSNFVALSYLSQCQLFYFENIAAKRQFIINIRKMTNRLFEPSYRNQESYDRIFQIVDLCQQQEITLSNYLQLQKPQIISLSELKINEERSFMLQGQSYAVYAQNNKIYKIVKFNDQLTVKPTVTDAGNTLIIVTNKFSTYIQIQNAAAIVSTYNSFKLSILMNQIRFETELTFKNGQFTIKSKQFKFQATSNNLRYQINDNKSVLISNGYKTALVVFDYKEEIIQFLQFVQRK
ncbi:Hypothetical_protein [Hexamita inflata]|uniref:Hypothetical_protein n=1 Tax=Hexamita inflata TaxID=28002 RepID=A0AA86RIH9_9EUKA|nr:Hypothetical protein HINF_LOCUS60414 [Hexamita inflata]